MSLLDIIEYRDDVSVVQGVVVGIVTNNKDPEGIGRVKLKFPWLSTEDESAWARVASPMAGKKRGIFFLPEVDDEVLVIFEHGDVNMPYIIGSLWNGVDLPPETNNDGKNNIRMIKSRSGHTITIDDTEGKEKIEIADKTGNNTIIIDTKNNKLSFKSDKDIEISAPNGKVSINAKDFEVKASTSAKVEASTGMDLKASGTMNIKGATVNIN